LLEVGSNVGFIVGLMFPCLNTSKKQEMQAICNIIVILYGPILRPDMGREYTMVLGLFWNKKSGRNSYELMVKNFKMLLMQLLSVNKKNIKIM
jgi:hypothetical protein